MLSDIDLSDVPPTLAAALQNGRLLLEESMRHSSTEAVDQIDNFIRRVQVLTRSELNRRRATLRVLPLEVVYMVFDHVLFDTSSPAAPRETVWSSAFRTGDAVITLSQVCRDWRRMLHNLPVAWNVITERDTDLFVKRSEHVPVSVLFNPVLDYEEEHSRIVRQLPGLAARIRELFWGTEFPQASKVAVLSFPAPQLEVLFLHDGLVDEAADGPTSFILFAGLVQRLRTLHLSCITWLPANHFPALTHLCLQNVHAPLTFAHIIGMLAHCPRLEHLAFIGAMPMPPDDQAHPPPRPRNHRDPLPFLRRMSFETVLPRFTNTIIHLLAPRQQDLALQALDIPVTPWPQPPHFPLCLCSLPLVDTHPFTAISFLRRTWDSNITISASSAHVALRLMSARTLPNSTTNPTSHMVWAVTHLYRFAFDRVQWFSYDFLHIRRGELPPGARELFHHARIMTNLQELSVRTNDLSAFLWFLYNGLTTPVAPNLHRPAWRLPTLRIDVQSPIGSELVTRDVFQTTEAQRLPPHPVVLVDKVIIHCSLAREAFGHTLRTLGRLCNSVEYGSAQVPPDRLRLADVADPVANPTWTGADWRDT